MTAHKITPDERRAIRKAMSALGKTSAAKLTPEERKERARQAGLPSGKARRKAIRTRKAL
jgi:hypothetical protein